MSVVVGVIVVAVGRWVRRDMSNGDDGGGWISWREQARCDCCCCGDEVNDDDDSEGVNAGGEIGKDC